jgi:hypothetical protein
MAAIVRAASLQSRTLGLVFFPANNKKNKRSPATGYPLALTFAQVSRSPTVRLNTGLPAPESGSRTK